MLSDFGHSLTVLSRKGLEGIEREMRDLALLLGAAGIVQVQCCPGLRCICCILKTLLSPICKRFSRLPLDFYL